MVLLIIGTVLTNRFCPVQLQKTEDSSADTLEFERLKEHFEPLVRAGQGQAAASGGSANQGGSGIRTTALSAINAAASSALSRDIPGVRRKGQRAGENVGRNALAAATAASNKEDFSKVVYRSRIDSAANGIAVQSEVDWIREMTQDEFSLGDVAPVEHRWLGSWSQSMKAL